MKREDWYEDLEEVNGCHVRVVMENGTEIYGRMDYEGRILPTNDCPDWPLFAGEDEEWHQNYGVKAVELLWDENNFKQINVNDAKEGDLLLIGTGRFTVTGRTETDQSHPFASFNVISEMYGGTPLVVFADMVSCALRRKHNMANQQ